MLTGLVNNIVDWFRNIMTPYYQDKYVTIYNADCLELLAEVESDSVDLLCTDPPYGISFMGKDWDKALPDIQIWKECLRVLKPGAFAFVMSIPRADCLSRMIISLENAGFRVNFTPIYWAYASGFPKAQNIGKAVDKRRGTHPDKSKEFAAHIKARREELGLGLTYVDMQVCGGTTNYSWFEGRPAGQRLPRLAEYERIKELLGLDERYDKFMGEAEREVVGQSDHKSGIGNEVKGHYTVGGTKAEYFNVTTPSTPQAKALDGSYGGFQPKPAVEVIIVAMKPLSEKTFVDQALKNGKGITWLDDCRMPYESEGDNKRQGNTEESHTNTYGWTNGGIYKSAERNNQGRFPANLIVSDDVLNDGRITTTSKNPNRFKGARILPPEKGWNNNNIIANNEVVSGDSGSFSRYFDLRKNKRTS